MNTKISNISKILLLVASLSLIVSIFVPIWRIELGAPQYPEGLCLQIYAYKLGGNVDIINGLNHYIGMKTLHAEDFLEFTFLPYIIGIFALMSIIVMIMARKKALYTLFTAFLLFGIIAMIDFWRWEYNYGHDLDPNAAIIVPGMAYQPPLIGFKQLLNFGAYSIPDIGGWLFIASGVLMLTAVIYEFRSAKIKISKMKVLVPGMMAILLLSSCGNVEKEPIAFNKEHCDNCQMIISDPRFAAELITTKGRIYKFDDITCMKSFIKSKKGDYRSYFISDYLPPHGLHNVNEMIFIQGTDIKAPMGGTIAAFTDEVSALKYSEQLSAKIISYDTVMK